MSLFQKINKNYPDIAKEIKYIPVYVDEQYKTYAERKALSDEKAFIASNPRWFYRDRTFIRLAPNYEQILNVEVWDPNRYLKFKYSTRARVLHIRRHPEGGREAVPPKLIHL